MGRAAISKRIATLTRARTLALSTALVALALALGAGALMHVHQAHAAGFSVTDCTSESGPNTIAQALADATADVGASETITFACGVGTHTIPITSPLAVNMPGKALTLDGGNQITLDGGSSNQLLAITNGASVKVQHLILSHGSDTRNGGAVHDIGVDLTLIDDTFNDDTAASSAFPVAGGAISMNGGALTVQGSTFQNNSAIESMIGASATGGAISYTGTGVEMVTITGSTFTGNSANAAGEADGGAIYAKFTARLTIANSTFTGNTVSAAGGFVGAGGAIYASNATLINDTLAGDSAISSTAPLAAQGGEVYFGATSSITNTILADGTANGTANNCAGPIIDGGNNLDSGMTCSFDTFIHTHSLTNTEPLLSTLANNGGPTKTMALMPTSPGIGGGKDTTCAATPVSGKDQRGVARPQGTHCDIGAYEFVLIASTITLTATPSTQAQGLAVQLCATVAGITSNTFAQADSITFLDGGSTLGTVALNFGKACLTMTVLSLGSHTITAHFSGELGYLPGTSKPVTVFIGVEGNGGAGAGAGTGTGPTQTGPNGSTNTGGPVTSNPGNNGSSSTAARPAPTTTASATSNLPMWLILAGIVSLVLLLGGAGGLLYRRRTHTQRTAE